MAKLETVKDGAKLVYSFFERIGSLTEYAYSEGNVDISDDAARVEVFAKVLASSTVMTLVDFLTNIALDKVIFAGNEVETTPDKIKDFVLRVGTSAVNQTINTTIETVYKSTMTEKEFLELVKEIEVSDTFEAILYDPITATWDIISNNRVISKIKIVGGN